MSRWVLISLGAAGLLLLVTGALSLRDGGLNSDDANVALTPLTKIPLDRIGTFGRSKLLIPDTPQWKRIRREWGDPEFTIAAVSPEKLSAYCLRDLGVTLVVTQRENPVPLEISYPPYMYGSGCVDGSFKFRAASGSELNVSVRRSVNGPLPSGELIIVASWPYTKDKLVGISLEEETRPALIVTSVLGLILVGSALLLYRRCC